MQEVAVRSSALDGDAQTVSIARTRQFDITSKINGRTYRIMVASPGSPGISGRYPVLYVLDGNQYFGTAAEAVSQQSHYKNMHVSLLIPQIKSSGGIHWVAYLRYRLCLRTQGPLRLT